MLIVRRAQGLAGREILDDRSLDTPAVLSLFSADAITEACADVLDITL